jgi:SUKH-4 immunity protein
MTDDEIAEALAPLQPVNYRKVPVEGKWRKQPPYPDRDADGRTLAVLCEDPEVSVVGVDRATGEVWLLLDDGQLDLVNGSVAALVACSQAYQKARRQAAKDPDDDDALEAIAAGALAELGRLDPAAVRDENQAWAAAVEEIEYGM